jgi:hypothetical protein
MRANEAANRQALFDLIFTGFEGQMRTGDSFGVWLFNEDLHAQQFPMQVWEESKPIESASNAAKYLRQQKYSGKARPDVLMPRLLKLIKNVRDVTVVILSDGEEPLEGTPFDSKIAGVYERRKSERNKEQKPFLTVLVAKGGTFVTGAVVIAGEYVDLPARPDPRLAGANTNNVVSPPNKSRPVAAAPTPIVTPLRPTGPPPIPTDAPQVTVTLSPPPPQPLPLPLAQPPASPSPPVTKVISIVTQSNTLPHNPLAATLPTSTSISLSTPEPVGPPTNSAAVVASTPAPPPPPQPSIPANTAPVVEPSSVPPATTPSAQPESQFRPAMRVAAREPASTIPEDAIPISTTTPSVNVATMPASGLTSTVLLTIGGLLLAGCLVLLALVLRRPKFAPQVSIITRSMDGRH